MRAMLGTSSSAPLSGPGPQASTWWSSMPTAAVGLITEPTQAEEILVSGAADAILLGRAMLRDPHWARRAAIALRDPSGPRERRYHRGWRGTVIGE